MTIDARRLAPAARARYVEAALEQVRRLAPVIPGGQKIVAPFSELLKFVVGSNYCGGCHDTSAVLHMLLADAGLSSELCIGEVGTGQQFFDHSWVEVEGLVFDVAVCMPLQQGRAVGGPVFGGVDLATGARSDLRYGARSGLGLDHSAQIAQGNDLDGYARVQDDPNIWVLAVAIASRCGALDATFEGFMQRYGKVRRTCRA